MSSSTDDVRIASARLLITPWVLAEELPLPAAIADARRARQGAAKAFSSAYQV